MNSVHGTGFDRSAGWWEWWLCGGYQTTHHAENANAYIVYELGELQRRGGGAFGLGGVHQAIMQLTTDIATVGDLHVLAAPAALYDVLCTLLRGYTMASLKYKLGRAESLLRDHISPHEEIILKYEIDLQLRDNVIQTMLAVEAERYANANGAHDGGADSCAD